MEIIKLTDENKNQWDEFCNKSPDSWFWHTIEWMDYTLNYRPDLEPKQMSFFVKENNQIVAICLLMIENYKDRIEFSFGGFAIPAPVFSEGLLPKIKKNTQNTIFEYIDAQAEELCVKKVSFRFSPLAPGFLKQDLPAVNYLAKYGYLDKSFETQIVDLSLPLDVLKNNVRKGHKYDINRSSKVLDVEIVYGETADFNIFKQYREMHGKDAGKYKRAQITYDKMFEWIKKGQAVLLGAKTKESSRFVGFVYFIVYKNGVYYASASKKNDMIDVPVAHFVLWEAVKWAKEKHLKYFEFGWQFYRPSFHYNTSKKELDISIFKRGFGGEPVPQIVSEKYYDAEFFEKEYRTRLENYKSYLSQPRQFEVNQNE